jgi:predicted NUDIX family phosphoesterase
MNQAFYTTDNKKHPAFILAIDGNYFESTSIIAEEGLENAFARLINKYPHQLFLEGVQSHLVLREREHLDESVSPDPSRLREDGTHKKGNPNYRQVLPYMVARQLQPDGTYLYFPYRRTKSVGESRLAGNGSIGYGGHVDLEDVMSTNSVIDLESTIILSMLREASEEFTIRDGHGDELILEDRSILQFADLFILDDTNEVGELHLGLVMHLDVPAGFALTANKEDHLVNLSPMTAEQMLTDPVFDAENWTRIYLEHVTKPAPTADESITGHSLVHGGDDVQAVDPEQLSDVADVGEDFTQSTDETDLIEKLRTVDGPVAQSLAAMLEVGEKMAEIRAQATPESVTLAQIAEGGIPFNQVTPEALGIALQEAEKAVPTLDLASPEGIEANHALESGAASNAYSASDDDETKASGESSVTGDSDASDSDDE